MRAIAPVSVAALIFVFGCGGNDSPTGPAGPARNSPPTASPSPSPAKPTGTKHGRIYFATASAGGMSISTDKDDYSPGDTVHFTGTGWTPGDTLNAVLTEDTATAKLTWSIPVAADSTFRDSTYVVSAADLGGTFTLTVTSKSDPTQTLTVVFTDAAPIVNSFTLDAVTFTFPAPPPPNQNATNPITKSAGSSVALSVNGTTVANVGGPPDATWKSTEVLVDPGTGFVSLTCDDFDVVGTSSVVTTTRAFSFNAPATAGTYKVRVKAYQGDACSGLGGSLTYNGVLIVTAAAPNLTITKVAANPNGSGGDSDPDWYYGIANVDTIIVTNSGTAATTGTITVTDTLPTQFTYNGYVGADWTCPAVPASSPIICTSTASIAASNGTSKFVLKVIPNAVANDVVNRASVVGGGDASSASSPNSQVDILPAPTTSAAGVKPSSQQYSDKTQLSDTVTTASTLGTIAGDVYFYVGAAAQACGTSAPAGSVGNAAVVSGVATYEYTIDKAAAGYTVTACFYSTNTNFTNSDDTATLTVTKEDATVDFPSTNPEGALVNTQFQLQATIWETYPELNPAGQSVAAGDISKAVVNTSGFVLKDILGGGTYTPSSCDAPSFNGLSGYAGRLTITCTFPTTVPVGTYAVQVTVSGDYYTGYGEDVFTVYDPSLGFITGGGRYMLDGERVNFGFTVKYNKKGTQPQGSLLVVRHHANGATTRAKSNVLSGLAVYSDKSATFSGKANYYDHTGAWLGNLAFTAYVQDVAEPGINKDLFGLYVAVTDANGVATTSALTGVKASAKVIVGGNIQVPQPSGGK